MARGAEPKSREKQIAAGEGGWGSLVGATARVGCDATSPGRLVMWGYRVIALSLRARGGLFQGTSEEAAEAFCLGF